MNFKSIYELSLGLVAAALLAAGLCLLLQHPAHSPPQDVYSLPRSSQWRTVRAEYLKWHPRCEACGANSLQGPIEVHHVIPFSTNPSLELDPTNLISLCRSGNNCHLNVGHKPRNAPRDWSKSNPDVREDAKKIYDKIYGNN